MPKPSELAILSGSCKVKGAASTRETHLEVVARKLLHDLYLYM